MDVKLCRLCAIKKDSFVGVYDDEGHKLRIESKINKCLQIEVGLGVVVFGRHTIFGYFGPL